MVIKKTTIKFRTSADLDLVLYQENDLNLELDLQLQKA